MGRLVAKSPLVLFYIPKESANKNAMQPVFSGGMHADAVVFVPAFYWHSLLEYTRFPKIFLQICQASLYVPVIAENVFFNESYF